MTSDLNRSIINRNLWGTKQKEFQARHLIRLYQQQPWRREKVGENRQFRLDRDLERLLDRSWNDG